MKSLVLIDNDALSRALLSQCLAGQGWRVLEAENGDAGLELVQKHQPAAVVCALRTPKRNGFKVCRHPGAGAGEQYARGSDEREPIRE